MDVSIIIVNYNTCSLTRNCLNSVFEHTKAIDFEVIVSDNGSKDGSIEMIKTEFPQVILIENNDNLGFGAANNRGLRIAKGKYIFYLNSDTILLNNSVKIFYDYWEKSAQKDTIGALGANLLNQSGEIIHSYGIFPRIHKTIRYTFSKYYNVLKRCFCKTQSRRINNSVAKYGTVEYITGADLFVKNNNNAYYDERYFLYFEEVDLQYKMYKKNLDRLIIDGPRIIHLAGGSDNKAKDGRLEDFISFGMTNYELSKIKYYKYNRSTLFALCLKILLYLFWILPPFYDKTKGVRKKIWEI